jgi:integrase
VAPKPHLHLPYTRWPAADRQLWQRAFCPEDPFAEGGHLAAATQRRCLWSWRRFLGFLAVTEPAALEIAAAERLTIGRVKLFITRVAETNAPNSVASIAQALYTAARVMLPEHDWGWLKVITSRLYKAAPRRPRMGPVITSMQLLDLGERLMDESKSPPGCPISKQDAVNNRDGFLAAFVAFFPIRPSNLAAIKIDRHLVRHGDTRFIIIPGEETKNAEPIEFPFPEELEMYLAYYLDVVRPRLLQQTANSALWVSRQRGALSQVGIVKVFQRISARLGVHISPHDGRDAAATLWAISRPDQISVASDLLGHADLRAGKHYNRARGIEASRAHARVIAAIRRKRNRHAR